MLCAKFDRNWPSDSGEEDASLNSLRQQRQQRQRRTTDNLALGYSLSLKNYVVASFCNEDSKTIPHGFFYLW